MVRSRMIENRRINFCIAIWPDTRSSIDAKIFPRTSRKRERERENERKNERGGRQRSDCAATVNHEGLQSLSSLPPSLLRSDSRLWAFSTLAGVRRPEGTRPTCPITTIALS